ncbi:hypothetical protein IQ07DRAFT_124566 [Pyrenochaeta sp. DS3sAY3a]|nr:hypothetical protein IQ07DRAFT_124566 [Pyrenochaeta sp. DS3sAY3a]
MSTTKAYPGSCHCGQVQYQVRLKLPPTMAPDVESVRIYKCNCTTCQKLGFFHCRPINPAQDFILTSPATIEELGEYRAFAKKVGWYFCKHCAVRVFAMGGHWEQVDLDVDYWAGTKEEEDKEKLQKVWRSNPETTTTTTTTQDGKKITKQNHYLSVNAVTLEPGGDVDLGKWYDNGWVFYMDSLVMKNGRDPRVGKPHEGGMY